MTKNEDTTLLFNTANKFIDLAKENDTFLSKLRLTNLVYLAFCNFLILKKKGLFPNDIMATKFGPKIPDLEIALEDLTQFPHRGIQTVIPTEKMNIPVEFENERDDFLSQVFTVFKNLDEWEINDFTSREGTPADIVFQGQEEKISQGVIRNYYSHIQAEQEKITELACKIWMGDYGTITPVPPKRDLPDDSAISIPMN